MVVALVALAVAACQSVEVSGTETISPPDAGASEFASVFSMDEGRIVARAVVGGDPVVYVFDRVGAGWSHSATLVPSAAASSAWGQSLAVSGDTIVVGDPYQYSGASNRDGVVSVYGLQNGAWRVVQSLIADVEFTYFGVGVWLSGDGLVVQHGRDCDMSCSRGRWTLYQRYGTTFREAYDSFPERGSIDLSVGVDQGRLALGNPGMLDEDSYIALDNGLMVVDATIALPTFVLDEITPHGDPFEEPPPPFNSGYYRKVDLSGDVLAYESCCSTDSRLHIRRDSGAGYQSEATFPVTKPSAWLSVVPGAVLVADPDIGGWHTFIDGDDGWQRSVDLPAPDAVAGQFAVQPIAVGNQVAVQGDGVLHVLTIDLVQIGPPAG